VKNARNKILLKPFKKMAHINNLRSGKEKQYRQVGRSAMRPPAVARLRSDLLRAAQSGTGGFNSSTWLNTKWGVMMKVGIFLLLLLASSFALSAAQAQCVKACCESSGGTYYPSSNGCDSPGSGFDSCAMACQQTSQKPTTCLGAVLPLFLLGIVFAIGRN
jgi:hypothetical protein